MPSIVGLDTDDACALGIRHPTPPSEALALYVSAPVLVGLQASVGRLGAARHGMVLSFCDATQAAALGLASVKQLPACGPAEACWIPGLGLRWRADGIAPTPGSIHAIPHAPLPPPSLT